MIFDTNKCISCQTCTVACKTTWTAGRGQEHMFWNNVETKPYGYYPLGWDVNILDRLGVQTMDGPVYQGKTLFDAAPQGEIILVSDDVNAPRLVAGDRTVVAFAAWEGGNREVGARKSWSPWVPLVIFRLPARRGAK